MKFQPGEICLCGHIYDEHFGACSKIGCQCKEFALIDAGVDIYEALKLVLAELKQRVAETGVERHIFEIKNAENAIRKAKGE